jgi:hypothetical protein
MSYCLVCQIYLGHWWFENKEESVQASILVAMAIVSIACPISYSLFTQRLQIIIYYLYPASKILYGTIQYTAWSRNKYIGPFWTVQRQKTCVIMTLEVRWVFLIWQSLWCTKLRKCSNWARMDDANAKSHRLWQLVIINKNS